jgi:hypothetical protein
MNPLDVVIQMSGQANYQSVPTQFIPRGPANPVRGWEISSVEKGISRPGSEAQICRDSKNDCDNDVLDIEHVP